MRLICLRRLPVVCLIALFVLTLNATLLSADTTVGGTISTDTVWSVSGSPYIVTSSITIRGTDGADGITTLTIAPGVTVKFNSSRSMTIGASSGDPGALVARGTVDEPITFTSNLATPVPGGWTSIYFYYTADDETSAMEHCIVEYGGYSYGALFVREGAPTFSNVTVRHSKKYGIYVDSGAPILSGCEFLNNQDYDLYYHGTTGGAVSNGTFNNGISLLAAGMVDLEGNTFNYNNSFPIRAYAEHVSDLVTGNNFTNLDSSSFLEVYGGDLNRDAVWTSVIPYNIKTALIVQGTDGPDGITTLTIGAGARLQFGKNLYLSIGVNAPGALVGQGTATAPIVFTSAQAAPAPGDWYGIRFYSQTNDATTRLEHCLVEYTGYNSNGAVLIQDASPALVNCIFQNSSHYDLKYNGTVGGTVSGCTIYNGVYLPSASSVEFDGNTIHYNNDFPIQTPADNVHSLLNGNTFSDLDPESAIIVPNLYVTKDASWPNAIPLFISAGLVVQGTDGEDGVTTLAIGPGTILKFGRNAYLSVGAGANGPGALIAQGTVDDPILFTSGQTAQAPGDWYGIRFYNTSDDNLCRLKNCTVEYGGYKNNGNVLIQDSAPSLIDCIFRNSSYYDLQFKGTVGGSVTGCDINSGIQLTTAGTVNFSNNTIHQNNNFPVKTYAENAGGISSSTFTDLDAASYLWVLGGTLSHDATWTANIPFMISNPVTVQGTDGSDGVTTLSINAGAILKFGINCRLMVGNYSGEPGALIAQGAPDNLILFTSGQPAPAPSDWDQIHFAATSAESSKMEYCVTEYAGSRAIFVDNSPVTISKCTIRNNSTYGLYISNTGANGSLIECNTFENNGTGIITAANAMPVIQYNNFVNNSSNGIRSSTTGLIAENNWWNDIAGPNQSGDTTWGDVDTDPWSTSPNICTSSGSNHPPHTPTAPTPTDKAVRVNINNGLSLTWAGGDPDPLDIVVYDIHLGTTAGDLTLAAQNNAGATFSIAAPIAGSTYFWRVTARDNHGLETTGSVWSFTTQGDKPDLIVSHVNTDPSGNLAAGQNATLSVTIMNTGTGPVVNSFMVEIKIDGVATGTPAVTDIMLAGQAVQISVPWTYVGGNPTIEILADSQRKVSETNEQNNQYATVLYEVADMTAPVMVRSQPENGAYLQAVNAVSVSLADSQSELDKQAVTGSFSVKDNSQQGVPGNVTESENTFTFSPSVPSLPDGTYIVSLVMTDIHGNAQNAGLSFSVDSHPPGKPVITGGVVASGVIQVRPTINTADQFVIELTGSRDDDTKVYINGFEHVPLGDGAWSTALTLVPGENPLEAWLLDRAGNRGPSEWVDIEVTTVGITRYEYNSSGRVVHIHNNP